MGLVTSLTYIILIELLLKNYYKNIDLPGPALFQKSKIISLLPVQGDYNDAFLSQNLSMQESLNQAPNPPEQNAISSPYYTFTDQNDAVPPTQPNNSDQFNP